MTLTRDMIQYAVEKEKERGRRFEWFKEGTSKRKFGPTGTAPGLDSSQLCIWLNIIRVL